MREAVEQAASGAVKVGTAVGVTVSGLTVFGVDLQTWVYVLTLVSLAVAIGNGLWQLYRHWQHRRECARCSGGALPSRAHPPASAWRWSGSRGRRR